MSKQSSIEWLVEQFPIIDKNDPFYRFIISSAKNLHKEEIIDAFIGHDSDTKENIDVAEQYYQETYGGNNESNT